MTAHKHLAGDLPIDSPDRRRLPPLLRRAWFCLNQAFRRRIASLEITPDQFTVMRTLLENEGITQRQLTHLISSDPNTIASLLERMETAGLIERKTHERDRRAHSLRLRATGQKKYEQARAIAIDLQSQVLQVLPDNKREEFLEHLALVADACRGAAEAAPRKGSAPKPGEELWPKK
ncbi:MAG: MarR family winged helix-turn-helix transcriptional regulator [Verrucomicrobia subdivision 3 bacterium]|nr:MarR family winged helix-turn-helix transcriptional regulator [Limisphaerales bacterium]